MHRTAVKKVVLEGVLDANDALAKANRQRRSTTTTTGPRGGRPRGKNRAYGA